MRVAFITPSFFGYEEAIAEEFRRQGVSVDRFDERPSNSALSRALLRVLPALAAGRVKRHFESILTEMGRNDYDALLVIKGENLPVWALRRIVDEHPHAIRVFYTFDSLSNSDRCLELFPYFHERYSFDRADVADRTDLVYKSLFFTAEFEGGRQDERSIDASFVGTLHSDRYNFYHRVVQGLDPRRRFAFFYSQALWYFRIQRILDRRMRRVRRSEVSFDKMSRSEVARIFGASVAVIDYQRPGQNGLTMRTFEALGSGAALVTSNNSVLDEDFYDPERILVVPRDAEEIDSEQVRQWIHRAGSSVHSIDVSRFRLSQWVSGFIESFKGGQSR